MITGKLLLPIVLSLFLAGCAFVAGVFTGAAVGIAYLVYDRGALTVVYEAPYIETWDATLVALERMNLEIQSKRHDLTAGKIEAKRADDKSVTVSMKYRTAEETEVVIRVGPLGDEKASMAIKEQIRKELFRGPAFD